MTLSHLALCLTLTIGPTDDEIAAAELARFPSEETVSTALRFAQEYAGWVRTQEPLGAYGRDEWYDLQREAERCTKPWVYLQQAQCAVKWARQGWHGGYTGLDWLADLRGSIGDEAYMAGEMPPGVPLWRFQQIR